MVLTSKLGLVLATFFLHVYFFIHTYTSRRKEEAAARAKAAMEKAEKLRKDQNYKNHFELASQRRFQSISRSYVFSYFNYVPPPRPKGDKKSKRTRQRPTRKK